VATATNVLDARAAAWQERARAWLAYGVRLTGSRPFDPALAEWIYRGFCPAGGVVIDPCAGDGGRGLVAHGCGLTYLGIEPRSALIHAHRAAAENVAEARGGPVPMPCYSHGYAQSLLAAPDLFDPADLIATRPPLFDLERYSDDPRDLSAMTWAGFVDNVCDIVGKAAQLLKQDRFSVWVAADVRCERGHLRGLPGAIVAAHERAGCALYNRAVYLPRAGPASDAAGPGFRRWRRLAKGYDEVLIFYKGNPAAIARDFPDNLPTAEDSAGVRAG
jgi:hypothetical protein